MITEAVLDFLAALIAGMVSLLPNGGPPGWVLDIAGYFGPVWDQGAGLGAWIPWGHVGNVVAAVLASVLIGFTIKGVRVVASFFTGGGGSAA